MGSKASIIVVGSANMDLIGTVSRFPRLGETITGKRFLTAPGGKGANQAVAAARLGADVSLVGCVGDDVFGRELLAVLEKENINTRFLKMVEDIHTGTALITVDEQANNQIIVIPGANHAITHEHIKQAYSKLRNKTKALLLQLEIPTACVLAAARLAKQDDLLVLLNPAPATGIPDELYKLVDYLIPNEHEAEILTGVNVMEEAARILNSKGAKQVIITLGPRGALYYSDKSPQRIPSYKVKAVDPTAAGDAFVAAFAVALLRGNSAIEAIRFANAAGALATTKIGAQPSLPTRDEVEQLLSKRTFASLNSL